MNNTPADLFELYLKTGVGGKPMIVDYEKSVIDFANSNPDGWAQVKDKIRNYISELKTYMNDINTLYPSEVSVKIRLIMYIFMMNKHHL